MINKLLKIKHIPCILWGDRSDKTYIFIHGKNPCKEDALPFADVDLK